MTETKFWEHLKSGHFAQMVREASKGKALSHSLDAYHVLKPLFAEHEDVECLYAIFLDGQNAILAIEKLFSGTISCASIFPREIIKRVLALKASAILIAHNHPSGNTTASQEDLVMTRKIIFSLLMIDVLLQDHLVVGDGYRSLADEGWIQSVRDEFQKLLNTAF